jgi:hypothetical protein
MAPPTAYNKAAIAGVSVGTAQPVIGMVNWLLGQAGVPPDISAPFAALLVGVLVAVLVHLVPNAAPLVEAVKTEATPTPTKGDGK